MPRPPAGEARLAKALERAITDGHPWIWRDALRAVEARAVEARPGDVVTVHDRKGRYLARGIADAGPIGVRVWTTRDEPVDARLFARRAEAAAALRDVIVPPDTSCYRLIHGEGDRLPGVVCDVYGDWAVLRLDGEGIARHRDALVEVLLPLLRGRGVDKLLARGDRREGGRVEALAGDLPTDLVQVREHGMTLHADLLRGQKTGLFLDHRESRRRVRALSRGLRVLNLYGYTGGFSVAAGLGGAAHVTTVDQAAPALALAQRAWEQNGLGPAGHTAQASDVPTFLHAAPASRRFDLVISDPPSFAPRKSSVDAALDSYRKLHAACLGRLEAGGLYLAASCSSHVRREDFDETLREGARAARCTLQVVDRWGAAPDHPRLLAFPEGDYLKVVLARVIG